MTGNHLDHAEKIPEVAQMTRAVDVFDPRSDILGPNFVCIYHPTGDRNMPYAGRPPLSHYAETYLLKMSADYEPPFFIFFSHVGYKYSSVGVVVILLGYSPLKRTNLDTNVN